MLVHIMRQLRSETQPLAQKIKHCRNGFEIGLVVKGRRIRPGVFRFDRVVQKTATAIPAQLAADHRPALIDIALDIVDQCLVILTAGMRITRHRRTTSTAQQIIDRHAGLLALDIPQRHIDTAQGRVEDGPCTPITAGKKRLPNIFDAADLAADQHRPQALFDRGDHRRGVVVLAGRADTVKPGLVGDNLDDYPGAVCTSANTADFLYLGHLCAPLVNLN